MMYATATSYANRICSYFKTSDCVANIVEGTIQGVTTMLPISVGELTSMQDLTCVIRQSMIDVVTHAVCLPKQESRWMQAIANGLSAGSFVDFCGPLLSADLSILLSLCPLKKIDHVGLARQAATIGGYALFGGPGAICASIAATFAKPYIAKLIEQPRIEIHKTVTTTETWSETAERHIKTVKKTVTQYKVVHGTATLHHKGNQIYVQIDNGTTALLGTLSNGKDGGQCLSVKLN